jgi:hypothetical protein
MHRRQLPVVQACDEDWEAMSGDERRRTCAECDQEVVDLSAMTEREARRVLAKPGPLCVRYRFASDGRIRFRPSPDRWPTVRRFAMAAGVASVLGFSTLAHADTSVPRPTPDVTIVPGRPAPRPERTTKKAPPPPPAPKPHPDDDVIMGKRG